MKFALFLTLISFSAFCQDTLFNLQDTVSIAPDGSKRSMKSLPYYVVPITDQRLREPSMGMSVLNLIRGQVPGFVPSPQFITTDPFNLLSFMVIDGAPVNSSIDSYSLLNTFDYQNPTVLNSNASTYYGMYGIGNGVLLNSRSGEGISKGQFSFNTFNTTGWQSEKGIQGFNPGQSISSNSLAYAKDFGAIDLRVSGNYSHASIEDFSSGYVTQDKKNNLNLKLNAGWNISSKLRARFILEKNSDKAKGEVPRPFSTTDHFEYSSASSRANLNVQYDATSWLTFSSRLEKSSINNDDRDPYYYNSFIGYKQDRNLVNLFANFDKRITDDIAISASTGYQREKATGAYPYHINSQMNTAGIRFRDQLFLDGNFRIDNSNIDPNANNRKTWSVSSGWVFTNLWKAREGFPYGKLRASVAGLSYITIPYYPQVAAATHNFLQTGFNHTKQYHRYEFGTDLLFAKGRIQLTANYIRLASDREQSVTYVQEGPLTITYYDYTNYFADMQQLSFGAYADDKRTVFSKLTVATVQSKKRTPPGHTENLTDGQPYYVDFLQTNTIGNVVVSMLLEGYSIKKDEHIWGIRQLSFSYSVMRRFAERRSVDPAVISLIGRGFMIKDESAYVNNGMAKSVSLGLL